MKNRKIGYTYGSVSGYYSFRKQKSIAFESTLERDLLTLLEFNDSVNDVVEQPCTIGYTNDNGRETTYTPDFLVHFNEPATQTMSISRKPLLIEVKPRNRLIKDWEQLRKKFKIAVKYAQANHMLFKIYDESRIRTPYLKNILFLKKYKKLIYDRDETLSILSFIQNKGTTIIEEVLEYLYVTQEDKAIALGHIWHLVSTKQLVCQLDNPLSITTTVWINENRIKEIQ